MILIRIGRVLGPAEGLDLKVGVVLDGDGIAGILPADQGGAKGTLDFSPRERTYRRIIEAKGLMAAPGLVDVHVYLRDLGPAYKEDIHAGARAVVKGGFTAVACMTNTNPAADNRKALRCVLEEGKETDTRMLSCAVVSKGFAGRELTDMEGLLAIGVAGFMGDGIPLMDGAFVRTATEEAARLDTALSFHKEDKYSIRENGINHGRISDELRIYGSPALAGDSLAVRDCMIAPDTGAAVDIQYISSGYSVGVVRLTRRLGVKVWAEMMPHHFALTEKAVLKYGTPAKMNPSLKAEKDRRISIRGFKDGVTDMIVTDRAPHSREEKERSLAQAPNGIPGLETALALRIINLVKADHLMLSKLMEKMSLNPARLYKLDCGHMEPGTLADLVLLDADGQWTVEGFESESTDSPFLGETLADKAMYTVCGGEVVYGGRGTGA